MEQHPKAPLVLEAAAPGQCQGRGKTTPPLVGHIYHRVGREHLRGFHAMWKAALMG